MIASRPARGACDRRLRAPALFLVALIALVVVAACAGCSTWQSRRFTDPAVSSESVIGRWRVTMSDGQRIELAELTVRGDSLHGFYAGDGARLDVPLNRVSKIEVKKTSATNTTLLILGLLVVTGVVAALVYLTIVGYPPD